MSNFRSRLSAFLYGRYGTDELYNALSVAELILLFIGAVFSFLGRVAFGFAIASWVLYALALALMGWGFFRFLSRNIAARRRENQVWLSLKARLFPARRRANLPPDTETHVFRACPSCAAVLRLPRTPGKHTVKCPRCGKGFGVNVR